MHCTFIQVALPDDKPEDIPALDKIPTNEFIENFLDDDSDDDIDVGIGRSLSPSKESSIIEVKKRSIAEPLPDDQDDLETVLDIKGGWIADECMVAVFLYGSECWYIGMGHLIGTLT